MCAQKLLQNKFLIPAQSFNSMIQAASRGETRCDASIIELSVVLSARFAINYSLSAGVPLRAR